MARPKSDIQDRILEAAHQRFLAEGVDAASLRNIAKDADTSIGMVYYYFTTKDELFLAVVEETYQRILADIDEIIEKQQSFRDRLLGIYSRIGRFSARELEVLQLVVRESLTSNERRVHLVKRFLRGHLPLLLRAVLEARESGELESSIDPIVAMTCSMGIGAVPLFMLRHASARLETIAAEEPSPSIVHDTVTQLVKGIPEGDALAQSLSDIAMRALGVKSSEF